MLSVYFLAGFAALYCIKAGAEPPTAQTRADAEVARPRLAVTLFTDVMTEELQRSISRYSFAVISMTAWPNRGERMRAHTAGIKALNPDIKLAQYTMLAEIRDPLGPNDPVVPLVEAINANDWWLRDASGARVPNRKDGVWTINFTAWTKPDSDGNRYPQVKASNDYKTLLKNMPVVDFVFIDGVGDPMFNGNFKRNGAVQKRTEPEVAAAFRKGVMEYVAALKTLSPHMKIVGNSYSMATPEYRGKIEAGYRECLIGRFYSLENKSWETAMDSYRAMLQEVKPPSRDVIFNACSADPKDPAMYRYGLASALLEDGLFGFTEVNYKSLPWYDESDAPIGTPAEPPPIAPSASGIWMRRYTNSMALVNPSKTESRSIDVGPGYRFVTGSIDPGFNTGLPVLAVTLKPRSGLILVKH